MTKILTLAALLGVILAGCVPFDRGYFKLNEAPRHDKTNWAAISEVVGHQLGRTHP